MQFTLLFAVITMSIYDDWCEWEKWLLTLQDYKSKPAPLIMLNIQLLKII